MKIRVVMYFTFLIFPIVLFCFISQGCEAPRGGGGFIDFNSCYPRNNLISNIGNLLQMAIFISLMLAFIPLVLYVIFVAFITEIIVRIGKKNVPKTIVYNVNERLSYKEYLKKYHSDDHLNWNYYESMYRRKYVKWLDNLSQEKS